MYRSYTHGFAITPSDSANTALAPFAVYVGGGGDINVILQDDSANTLFKAVPTGTTLSVRVIKVWSAGTTANNIVGLY